MYLKLITNFTEVNPTLEDSGCGAECDAARRQGFGDGHPDGHPDGGHEREDADVDHVGDEGGSGRHLD